MPLKNKHILILGSARSGTSWLAENLASQHRYRLLFEPEHTENTKSGYLLADKSFSQFPLAEKKYFTRVLANRVDNDWIAQHSVRKYKRHLWPFIPKYFVVKCVRCNLIADAIADEFNIPIVFISRNPFEVVRSELRVNFPWLKDLSSFKADPKIVKAMKERTGLDIMNESFSYIELLALRWGIENALFKKLDHPLIRYYDHAYLQKNEEEIRGFMKWANMNIPDNLSLLLKRKSSKMHWRSTHLENPVEQQMSGEQRKIVKNILIKFPYLTYSLSD